MLSVTILGSFTPIACHPGIIPTHSVDPLCILALHFHSVSYSGRCILIAPYHRSTAATKFFPFLFFSIIVRSIVRQAFNTDHLPKLYPEKICFYSGLSA